MIQKGICLKPVYFSEDKDHNQVLTSILLRTKKMK